MARSFFFSLVPFACLVAFAGARESVPPAAQRFERAQAGPKADEPAEPTDDPQKIIERIKQNQELVRKLLARKDAGLETRNLQRKIADDMGKLLQQQENDPAGNDAAKDTGTPKQTHRPQENIRDKEPKGTKEPKGASTVSGQNGNASKPIAAAPTGSGAWHPELPLRHRQEIDATPRDRFMPRYEEMLRAYYRTIAESGPRKEGD